MPKKTPRPKHLPYNGWTPMKDGVSQSLLQKFRCDKERFRLHAIEMLREVDRKEAMEYGTIFHKLIELGASLGNKYTRDKLMQLMSKYLKTRHTAPESVLLCKVAIAQYHLYREWEATREKYKYIDQEPVFCENFTLPPVTFHPNEDMMIRIPSGVTIPLRGRIDEVIEKNGMWIQENKTKSRINISQIQDTIHANIQVMFYAVCSELKYGRPCKGVIYNVIRKPGEKQHQKESEKDYVQRIVDRIKEDPNYYFYRLKHEFQPGQVEKWKREELIPLLYDVYLWWRSIEKNPHNPWVDENGNPNPFHGRKSFGIYDSMSQGKGDFYDYIVYGRKTGLTKVEELFPELQEETDD